MAERFFRALLKLYPREFRDRYGPEQVEFFRQEWATLSSHSNLPRILAFWWSTVSDEVVAAARIRTRSFLGGSHEGPSDNGAPGKMDDSGGSSFVTEVLQDARFALRTLRKQPGFTLVAVGVVGIGIAASTTLFSAVNGVLLRPLPYPEQDRLVYLGSKYTEGTRISAMSVPELMDVMNHIESVEGYAAVRGRALDLVGEGEPERVAVAEVSPDYFQLLGASPVLGPGFSPESQTAAGDKEIMVSDGLWRRRWGGDPGIVGRTILASDGYSPEIQTFTIVGVLPPGFVNPPPLENPFSRLPSATVWAPLPLDGEMYTTPRTHWTVRSVGRLRSGSSLESLSAELEALGLSLGELYPEAHLLGDSFMGLGAKPLLDEMVGSRRQDLMILLGATGLLLLIACANVAGLQVARALDRSRELGLRTALGAGRRRLFLQLLTESLVLAGLGGAVGVGLAVLGVGAFRALDPADFPRLADVTLDLRVLAFGVGVAALTGILFGVGPALAGSRERKRSVLAPSSRGGTAGGRTVRIRGGLVVLEVALAMVLLTGCGLLTRSIVRLQGRDPGIDTEGLALMQVRLLPSYDEGLERSAFFSDLRTRLTALPGVLSASYVIDPPMAFGDWAPEIWREEDAGKEEPTGLGRLHTVGLDYFRTMGISVLSGRTFVEGDDADALPVAMVSKTLADALWPGEDPLGKRLGISINHDGHWVTIVGLVGDIRQRTLASDPSWDFYVPFAQSSGSGGQYMLVRTAGEPLGLAASLRQAVWALDESVPVPEITTMKARVDATLRLPRFRTFLLAGFAGVALVLAATGIYGTLMYTVGRRTAEVGIRMALGAEARDVVGLVLRQGMRPVVVGLGLGLAGSLAATRLLESVLFQVSPSDPATFGWVAATLVGVSLLASYIPARRASRVDPQTALRAE